MHFVPITAENVASSSKPKDGQKFTYKGAPILTGCFTSENTYVGSGYDKTPVLFKIDAKGQWAFVKFLDDGISKVKQSKIGKDAFGGKEVFFDGLTLAAESSVQEKDTKH